MALTNFLKDIADAIRYAEKSSNTINAQDFAIRIRALSGQTPTEKTLSSISATKTKTTYEVNDAISTNDISVMAHYSDDSTYLVNGWTTNANSIDMTTEGNKSLVISYTEKNVTKTDTITLTVTSVEPQPTPSRPDVPQIGTWQFKTTHKNGYVIIGKDDDTSDQAMFVRMVSGYGFPVTINTTFNNAYDMVSHKQTSDADTDVSMYPEGSVSRFSEDTNVHSVNMAIVENNLGEVAQHGASTHSLWKSSEVTDSQLDTLYATYTEGGGTRTKDEFFIELKRSNEDSDVDQGASYVHTNRASLEADLNYPIFTLGTWGTSEFFVVDGINVCPRSDLSCGGSSEYARGWNYWGDGPVTGYSSSRVRNPWRITRLSDGFQNGKTAQYCESAFNDNLCIELFGHKIFSGKGTTSEWTNFKNTLDTIKSYVDAGKIQVVTRYQYSQLGEFVSNPITAISVTRNGNLNVGDTDSDSAYIVTVTYADGTSAVSASDKIIDRSSVNTSQSGNYNIKAYYRGFTATCVVSVINSDMTYPEGLKNKEYWFVAHDTTQDIMVAMNTSGTITTLKNYNSTYAATSPLWSGTSGKLNAWTSTDGGKTWTQEATNISHYNTVKLYDVTSVAKGDNLVMLEYSNNFTLNYFE